MATVTWRATNADTGNTPNVCTAFTPTQGDLLVVFIVATASVTSGDLPSASANGITFVSAGHRTWGAGAHSHDIYVAEQLVGVSPASMTITWDPADTANGTVIDVYSVSGGGNRVGAGAIRQTAGGAGIGSTDPTTTFSSACLTSNPTILSMVNETNPNGVSVPSGWSNVNAVVAYSSPTVGYQGDRRNSGFTGTQVTWGSTSASAWDTVGVEIDASVPGTATLSGEGALSVYIQNNVPPTLITTAQTAWNSTSSPQTTSGMNIQAYDMLVDLAASAEYVDAEDDMYVSNSGTAQTWIERQTDFGSPGFNCYVSVATSQQSNADSSRTISVTYNKTQLFGHLVAQFRNSWGIGYTHPWSTSGSGQAMLSASAFNHNSALVVFIADFSGADGSSRTWGTLDSYTPTAGNGGELLYHRETGVYTVYAAYYPDAGAAGSKYIGLSSPSSLTYSAVVVEVYGRQDQGGPVQGYATLSGSGSLATSNILPAITQTAGLTGSGALTTAQTPAIPGTAGLSGSGTLAAPGSPGFAVAAGLSGAGTLGAEGTPGANNFNGTWSPAAEGTTAWSGSPGFTGISAALSGSGVLGTAASLALAVAVGLSGSGTLGVTCVPAFAVTAGLSGEGTLATTTTPAIAVQASMSGAGTLGASGQVGGAVADVATSTVAGWDNGGGSVSVPSGTVNGDLLVAVAVKDSDTTISNGTLPAAWTASGTYSGYNHIKTWYRYASSEPGSYTYTGPAGSSSVVFFLRITGGPTSGDPFDVTVAGGQSTGSTTVNAPSISPTGSNSLLICGASEFNGNGGAWTPPGTVTELQDFQPAAGYIDADIAKQQLTSSGPTGTRTFTSNPADSGTNKTAYSLAIKSGSGNAFSGTATLSGSGTLSTARTPGFTAIPATLSGSGTLDTTRLPAYAITADLSGSGTLATTQIPTPGQTAGLSGAGTLEATGQPGAEEHAGSLSTAGEGTLSFTPAPNLAGTADLSGSGVLTATGIPGPSASPSLSGEGTLGATASPSLVVAVPLSGSGQLTSTVTAITTSGTAGLSGAGTLSALAAAAPVSRVAVTTSGVQTATPAASGFTPTLPTHAAGDRLVLIALGKYNTTTVPTINQGWTTVESGTGGTGTTGADVGQTFWVVYAKDATSSSETAPTVTAGATAPNSWTWIAATHRLGVGMAWADAIATGGVGWVVSASDTTTGSPLTGTTDAFSPQVTAGDAIFAVGVIPTDLGTALGTTTITETGLSGGTKDTTTTNYAENALGGDSASVWTGWTEFTGTGTAGVALSFTVTGATNQSGSLVALAFRQQVLETHLGSWDQSGSGTLSFPTQTPGAIQAVDLSGSGTLAATASPAWATAASLSGSGALSTQALPGGTGTAALTGSGALTTTQIPAVSVTAALSGSGALQATGEIGGQDFTGSASFTGSGVLSFSGAPAWQIQPALAGSGTLATTQAPSFAIAAALSGSGTLGAVGQTGEVTGTATLSGSGSLTTARTPGLLGTATLAGSGTLAYAGIPQLAGTLSLAGGSSLFLGESGTAKTGQLQLSGSGEALFIWMDPNRVGYKIKAYLQVSRYKALLKVGNAEAHMLTPNFTTGIVRSRYVAHQDIDGTRFTAIMLEEV